MPGRRLVLLLVTVSLVLMGTGSPVSAAVGDSVSDPIVLSAPLPITVATDTTAATSDATDPDVWCGPLRPNATTFYSHTASVPTYVTFVGDDRGRAAVYAIDDGGNLQNMGCLTEGVLITLSAGQRYVIMVFQCCDPGDPGGLGTLGLRAVPPPLDADVNITSTVVERPTGVVRISGTVNCNTPADVFGGGELRQRNETAEFSFGYVPCDESGQGIWSATVAFTGGALRSGTARLTIGWGAVSWGERTQDAGNIDMDVRLKTTHG